ncbi:Phosphoglycerate kinase [Glycine soja]|uniref:Phosphoglycerate kinase n=1 Tax=Glycine soja TaxID=3848 RepID=A0A445FCE4_GLYSO|nr:Phosphoglycerate kinase [Glycine soja]
MGSFCESRWEWKFSWRRNLFDNEMGIASDFLDQTAVINLNVLSKDSWVWGAASNGIFSSKSAYLCIKAELSPADHQLGFCQLWDTKIPPRALTFAWRLLWDRLPTKENLSRRNVDLVNDLCPFCQSSLESASHLFFSCHKVMPLWWEFNTWVKKDRALHCRPMEHFLQQYSIAGSKASNTRRKIWWIAATTSIWKLRNDVIFHNQPFQISKLVDNTNFLTWSWLRGWEKDFNAPFHQWEELFGKVVMVRFDSNILLKRECDEKNQSVSNVVYTIKYLPKAGAKVILVSDWNMNNLELQSQLQLPCWMIDNLYAIDFLSEVLQIQVVPLHGISFNKLSKMNGLEKENIHLLENLSNIKEEVANCVEFARVLSSGVDIFVNYSFSNSHKVLASTVGVTRFWYACIAGFYFEERLCLLKNLAEASRKPYVAIIGGGNLYDKAASFQFLASRCQWFVFVGMMPFQVMHALGVSVPRNLVDHKAFNEALDTVRLTRDRNMQILYCIATNATSTFHSIVSSYPGELVLVSIQCPNPDFNKPEHRWRMLQRSLIEAVVDLLAPNGKIFLQSDVEAVAIRMKEQFLTYGKGKLDMEHGQSEWLEENPFGLDQIGKGMF